MKQQLKLLFFYSLVVVGVSTFAYSSVTEENFENVKTGHLPKTWKSAATNAERTTAVWEVVETKEPFRGKKVLSLSAFDEGYGGSFNLCYTNDVSFKDGEISVWFKANNGKIDQGGGIMWRVQDKDTYYVARFNPLEDNFRFYSVINGDRKKLYSADVHLEKGWHLMKIIQKGSHFEGFLNGKKLLSYDNDAIKKSGGVGVWTKADAATSFDDFTVKDDK
ncbi:family 16 glycoside hydrolase [Sulfurovum lithotrophicum]|uniref:family 16 glycoside hydrolase n=1 Tax=Sulfurovum lithotrophicum TaxID=206403 RepID=UPI000ACF40BE|nr:family 16 glycoside hydrolase [Sulfurovum lithotrophicum]